MFSLEETSLLKTEIAQHMTTLRGMMTGFTIGEQLSESCLKRAEFYLPEIGTPAS
jgi:hypothetical protein